MKGKGILGIAFALLMIGTMFTILPTRGYDGQIKIGIIGPQGLPHWSPGMKEAAEMARDEINTAGGVNISGLFYEIVLAFGNEYAYPTPDPVSAAAEMERLCDPGQEDCDFVIGGFRTECTTTMIEVAADYNKTFIINGASTDQLLTNTIGTNYARYKYLYRINPVNSTQLFYTIAGATRYYLIPAKLLPLFGHDLDGNATTPPQVRIAVLMEDLEWTQTMYFYLTNPAVYPAVLGPNVNVTYAGRIPDGTTDCSTWLNDVKASQARLLIHVFSGVTGVPLVAQAKALNVSALLCGINVLGQLQSHWATTGGACEYESQLAFSGTRTPIVPGVTTVFWDNFVAYTGAWPLYTAWGAYDGVYAIKEAIEAVDSTDKDSLRILWESPSYMRQGLNGIFKYTSIHDVLSFEPGPTWNYGFVRAFMAQWVNASGTGETIVVSPIDQCYSCSWLLPPNLYPHREDVNVDGKVDMRDIGQAARAFGHFPCDGAWDKEADIVLDYRIDMRDIGAQARKFGLVVTLPLP